MSYLFPNGSATELGVLQVGSNIDVDANSVISIPQSVATSANVTFGNVTDSALTAGRITFAGTAGILTDDGDLTYNSTTNVLTAVSVSVSGALTLGGNSVVTSVTPTAGTGISLTGVTTSGPAAAFTVNNTGVTSIIAGTNISISSATGAVTINASTSALIATVATAVNYTALATDDYIGVTANPTTVTLPTGIAGKTYIIKNETTGNTTVQGTGGQLLDSSLTKVLGASASITVVFRGTAWHLI